jgi:multiple sugar transport system permease protein
MFVTAAIAFFPIGYCIWMSLHEFSPGIEEEMRFVGLKNYTRMLNDQRLGNSLVKTLIFTGVSVPLELILGLIYALVLRCTFRGRGLFRASALIPWALPPAVMAMAWSWIFNGSYGILSDILLRLGVTSERVAWLADPDLAMACIIVADVWKTTPFISIVLLAGLQSIQKDLYEAASIDGAGPVRRFFLVTLPLLRPYIAIALLFRTVQAFGIFDLIWVMTKGGPEIATETLAPYIYLNIFRYSDLGYGAALTILLAICLTTLAFIILLIGRRPVQRYV